MITVSEAATVLDIPEDKVRRLLREKRIPGVRHGRDWIVYRAEIFPSQKKMGRPRKAKNASK